MKDKTVLIVGNSYALAKRLSNEAKKVYVIPGNKNIAKFAECVDIRENNTGEILNFALENDIDLTIVSSIKAIQADIATLFQEHNKIIFAPTAKSAEFVTSASKGKRLLYKLHIPTPKFGFFDKLPSLYNYLEECDYPIILRSDTNPADVMCCTGYNNAKLFAEDILSQGAEKVVAEDFVYGDNFTMYFVTDGYHTLPITTVRNYNFTENGNGGLYTNGVGCNVPYNKLCRQMQETIFVNAAQKIISFMESKSLPYVGLLGIIGVLTKENEYKILGFKPFFDDFESQAILNNIDEDLIDLFDACANGFFADEYEDIITNDNFSTACLINSRKENLQPDKLDICDSEITYTKYNDKTVKGDNFVLTSCAKTLSRAKKVLSDDINLIKFEGMKVRSDIYS